MTKREQKKVLPNAWLTPIDLELEYKIARGTQGNLRSQGLLPYHKKGRMIRYKRSDIDAWFESGKVV